MARSLRPSRADDLGLRRALSDRLLPLLVAAMIFLAALALAGAQAAAGLAQHWRIGASSMMTVQVPRPEAAASGGGTRAAAAARILAAQPHVAAARRLSPSDIAALLQPWLGIDPARLSLPLPAVFEVRLVRSQSGSAAPGATLGVAVGDALGDALARAVPGTLVEHNGAWLDRLADLVRSLQACATLALGVVVFVATAVVAVATRAGLAARRDAIEIVHGLGATDGMIAGQFAGRVTALALAGAVLGLTLALPFLLGLANLAAPFLASQAAPAGPVLAEPATLFAALPPSLWAALAVLPPAAALIGWATAQGTVRVWLARLP
jgi:cell division transport system permease protein